MGLLVDVYRRAGGGDCTNGGISSRYDSLCVVNVDGPFEPSERACAVMLCKGAYGSKNIKPAKLVDGVWVVDTDKAYMAGGNFADACDSRFSAAVGFYGAVSIHDRTE